MKKYFGLFLLVLLLNGVPPSLAKVSSTKSLNLSGKEEDLVADTIRKSEIVTYTDKTKLPRISKKVDVPQKLVDLYSTKPAAVIMFLKDYAKTATSENSAKAVIFAVALVESPEAAYPFAVFDVADYDKEDSTSILSRKSGLTIIEDLLKQIKK